MVGRGRAARRGAERALLLAHAGVDHQHRAGQGRDRHRSRLGWRWAAATSSGCRHWVVPPWTARTALLGPRRSRAAWETPVRTALSPGYLIWMRLLVQSSQAHCSGSELRKRSFVVLSSGCFRASPSHSGLRTHPGQVTGRTAFPARPWLLLALREHSYPVASPAVWLAEVWKLRWAALAEGSAGIARTRGPVGRPSSSGAEPLHQASGTSRAEGAPASSSGGPGHPGHPPQSREPAPSPAGSAGPCRGIRAVAGQARSRSPWQPFGAPGR